MWKTRGISNFIRIITWIYNFMILSIKVIHNKYMYSNKVRLVFTRWAMTMATLPHPDAARWISKPLSDTQFSPVPMRDAVWLRLVFNGGTFLLINESQHNTYKTPHCKMTLGELCRTLSFLENKDGSSNHLTSISLSNKDFR